MITASFPLRSTFAGDHMHHRPWRRPRAQGTALAGQAKEEEGREGSRDLKQATTAETRAVALSQAGGLVWAANPSLDSRMQTKNRVDACNVHVKDGIHNYHNHTYAKGEENYLWCRPEMCLGVGRHWWMASSGAVLVRVW